MHALLDEKIGKVTDPKKYLGGHAICEKNCECGLALVVLEHLPKEQLTEKESIEISEIQRKASTMTNGQALACAKKNRWFCKSALLRELKASQKEFLAH